MLGLWSQPKLGSFELSARTSLVLATHGAVVAAHGVEIRGWERVLTEAASRPGARSHLQQSEEKHVRLCWEPGHEQESPQHLPLPRV